MGAAVACRQPNPFGRRAPVLHSTVDPDVSPRLVDWAILIAVGAALLTGVWTLFAGTPGDWWVVAAHAVAGLVLVVPLGMKLHRERHHFDPRRLRRRWRRTAGSILLTALAVAAIVTGLAWTLGADFGVLAWSGLVVHAFLGLLLVPLLLVHLRRRFHVPRSRDLDGRRTAIQTGLLVAGGTVAWRAQNAIIDVATSVGDEARFTGSRPTDGEGNDFPITSWVADDPAPVDRSSWRLDVVGAVDRPEAFDLPDLEAGDDLRATLDCTSGWYARRDWQGLRVGRLLEAVGPEAGARWVSFRSVTGYRFSLPIEEARGALLATHVDGEPLEHGHGFPVRLVAPGRRGYQWVKWVDSVEVRRTPDYGQWWAIFVSGFG